MTVQKIICAAESIASAIWNGQTFDLQEFINVLPWEKKSELLATLPDEYERDKATAALLALQGAACKLLIPELRIKPDPKYVAERIDVAVASLKAVCGPPVPPERIDVAVAELKKVCESAAVKTKPATPVPPAKPKRKPAPVIHSLGNYCYRVGSGAPVPVTGNEDLLLQAFLKCPALRMPDMGKLSHIGDEAPRVLKRLTEKYGGIFAPAIHLPGIKNAGGYRVEIRKGK